MVKIGRTRRKRKCPAVEEVGRRGYLTEKALDGGAIKLKNGRV
jgi:hypothetical protein